MSAEIPPTTQSFRVEGWGRPTPRQREVEKPTWTLRQRVAELFAIPEKFKPNQEISEGTFDLDTALRTVGENNRQNKRAIAHGELPFDSGQDTSVAHSTPDDYKPIALAHRLLNVVHLANDTRSRVIQNLFTHLAPSSFSDPVKKRVLERFAVESGCKPAVVQKVAALLDLSDDLIKQALYKTPLVVGGTPQQPREMGILELSAEQWLAHVDADQLVTALVHLFLDPEHQAMQPFTAQVIEDNLGRTKFSDLIKNKLRETLKNLVSNQNSVHSTDSPQNSDDLKAAAE